MIHRLFAATVSVVLTALVVPGTAAHADSLLVASAYRRPQPGQHSPVRPGDGHSAGRRAVSGGRQRWLERAGGPGDRIRR